MYRSDRGSIGCRLECRGRRDMLFGMSETPARHEQSPPAGRRMLLALVGFLLQFAGPALYTTMLSIPWARSSGAPAFALMIVGVAMGFLALRRDRRLRVKVVAAANVVLLATFTFALFWLAKLPQPTSFARLETAPDFVLPNESGTPTTLSKAYATGPVLLVFYRGHW